VQPHSDPHDPVNDDERLNDIALAAFGEPLDPSLASHLAICPICSDDFDSLERTVALAREDDPHVAMDVQPPAGVWAGIAAAIAEPDAAAPQQRPAPGTDGGAHRVIDLTDRIDRPERAVATALAPRRWLLAAAAAVVLALGGAAAGYALGSRSSDVLAQCQTTQASLAQLPGGPAGVDGSAEVYCADEGRSLRVTTARLPLTEGFYEVWLYSPSTTIMVPIGALGEDGTGSFTLPPGMDLGDFHIVDVSHQQFNGNPAHDQSVLQGPLTN
jgi:hypothetical protein